MRTLTVVISDTDYAKFGMTGVEFAFPDLIGMVERGTPRRNPGEAAGAKKNALFPDLALDMRGYVFNRQEANER